ncbi:adhesion G-protein coupled receptor V1-like isoform X2 [Hydractinia symbiolongicarpus]|uniref:adhesion G-protein coupled receptor V1-like isoform X2 n=1 Tax=Hydractinia symbiolongicarpus TaxID=13093 RepID=UPI0025519C7F|nr:adhesion G-protein coupled receptor V1-like isoform X2 [Hydractinia symbiolongicarpus]
MKFNILKLIYLFLPISLTLSYNILSFRDTHYVSEEVKNGKVDIVVISSGPVKKDIFLTCSLPELAKHDFISLTVANVIRTNTSQCICRFYINDDTIPEGNATYPVTLNPRDANVKTQSPNVTFVTILANDDPYGCIGISNAIKVITINEPNDSPVMMEINVTRYGGRIGNVSAHWQIFPRHNLLSKDISPSEGYVYFAEDQANLTFAVNILPDDIPESREIYNLRLVSVTGGACLREGKKEIEIRIEENDAPISFKTSALTFTEPDKQKVTVCRGIDINGRRIGPTSIEAKVLYHTVPGSAKPDLDYVSKKGEIVFEIGTTQKDIDIEVLSDPLPELPETFFVVLTSVTKGVILSEPSVLTITISKNDNPHGLISFTNPNTQYIVDEDSLGHVDIPVIRSYGKYGNISVQWEVKSENNPVAAFVVSSGFIDFKTNESFKNISLSAKVNNMPSEAMLFNLTLINATNGARLLLSANNENPSVQVVVADSDNAYGMFDLAPEDPKLILSSTPRRLEARVIRSGGNLAEVTISYSIQYFLPGSTYPAPTIIIPNPGVVTMSRNKQETVIAAEIMNDAFLKSGSAFTITLQNVTLSKSTLIKPSSPTIGSRDKKHVNITQSLANGEIGFFNSPVLLDVDEPNVTNTKVCLTIMRDGASMDVLIYWRVKSDNKLFTREDVNATDGFVMLRKGIDRQNISFEIMADDTPELDEDFIVELYNTTGRNEKLRSGATNAYIKIRKNDNPGGEFEFRKAVAIVLEESSSGTAHVIRTGGSLERQKVLVRIENGENDFRPYEQIIEFMPAETEKMVFLFPQDDDIPELAESFDVHLYSVDGSVLGNTTTFKVTILESDEPYGLIAFSNSPLNINQTIRELPTSNSIATFQVSRSKGTLGAIDVFWAVANDNHNITDLNPLNGMVNLREGHNTGTFSIIVKQDQIPEKDELFEIFIVNVTGGARLIEPSSALLTIIANDFPVTISPSYIYIEEGESSTLFIHLKKSFPYPISVLVETEKKDVSDDDFVPFVRNITFLPGETTKPVQITTMDDKTPELDETFTVTITSVTGDNVIFKNYSSDVIIKANDDPYGVFTFHDTVPFYIEEGETLKIRVDRLFGTFGEIKVLWRAINFSNHNIEELSKNSGAIVFNENQTVGYVETMVKMDYEAELNETFSIQLINITGGRLGNMTVLEVTILSNDYPNGVFMIDTSNTTTTFAEDFDGNDKYKTQGHISFMREQGSFYAAEITWEIYRWDMPSNLPNRIWDLLLRKRLDNLPSEVNGRKGSSTVAYKLTTGSCLIVPLNQQPSAVDLAEGFTFGMWMKPSASAQMNLINKLGTTNVIYNVMIDTRAQPMAITLSVGTSSASVNNVVTSFPRDFNFLDGEWHSLFVTFSKAGKVNIYSDGLLIKTSSISSSDFNYVIANEGVISLGCSQSNSMPYIGSIQDVRIYPVYFETKEITMLHDLASTFDPFNGKLSYLPGETTKSVPVSIIDDDVAEPNMFYVARIIDVTDDQLPRDHAVLSSTNNTAMLEVLKSDYANGVFGLLHSTCIDNLTESLHWNVTIERTRGLFGAVAVGWELTSVNNKAIAAEDFVNATGNVYFLENENKKMLEIAVFDDLFPEEKESFIVKLTSVIPADKQNGSTLKSGAVINESRSQCQVSILPSDYPSGILQLMDHVPHSSPFIKPIKSPLHINIDEEQGTLNVYIVRSQGLQGTVSVEWKTESVTAVGGKDYHETLGSISLKPGEKSAVIAIDLIDNDVPELFKIFKVLLRNPTGGAIVDAGSEMYVRIKPSDNALGMFSLNQTIFHTKEGTTVDIPIYRVGGSLGGVNVTWTIVNGSADFLDTVGTVMVAAGKMVTTITIVTIDEDVPELDESFVIKLVNVSGGTINQSADAAIIKIQANDHPYGLFNFQRSMLYTNEANKTIPITIIREKGTAGTVRVFYNVGKSFTTNVAEENTDFIHANGFVTFFDEEKQKNATVTILDDDVPEVNESFLLNITHVTVLNQTDPVHMKMIGNNRLMHVIITSNDNANGVLTFKSDTVYVNEDHIGGVVNVTRSRGLFGKISFTFKVKSQSAHIGADFTVNAFDVVMVDGQKSVQLPIYLISDEIPEFNESFSVEILPDTIKGGAVVSNERACMVIILENDYPYGLIGFSGPSVYAVKEPLLKSQVLMLPVVREKGQSGVVQLQWIAESMESTSLSTDMFPTQGTVGFLTGESKQNIQISVMHDNIPEVNETFTIRLSEVSMSKAKINKDKSQVKVTILPNDNPYGTVEFVDSVLFVKEKDFDYNVSVLVQRSGGLHGDLIVFYHTVQVALNKADGGTDYEEILNDGNIIISNGSSQAHINILIFSDLIPEMNETFQVKMTRVEVRGINVAPENKPAVGKQNMVNVTIESNDNPYGLFLIMLDLYNNNNNTFILSEPEEQNIPLKFNIIRAQGLFGTVSVSWRLLPGFTITPGQDVSGATGSTITFSENEQKKSFTIFVNKDDIPEDDEQFTIQLYNPTGEAAVSKKNDSVKVIISANDNVGGVIGFQRGSLSKTASEGDVIKLYLLRSRPGLGTATVTWEISGDDVAEDFAKTSGIVTFRSAVLLEQIELRVLSDLKPEPNENFIINLTSVDTSGISKTGAAILDPSTKQAFISLGASNDPHGVFEFSPVQQPIYIKENIGILELMIIRRYGKLGVVDIYYEVQSVNSSLHIANASIPEDVLVQTPSVRIRDGIDSVKLLIPIVNDDLPEINEGFVVKLTSVVLRTTPKNSSMLPKIGLLRDVVVVIDANDGAAGELFFTAASLNLKVEEYNHSFNLTVYRSLGAFGDVYCFYFLNRLTSSVNDFYVSGGVMNGGPAKLVFKDDQRTANITVYIKDDFLTEDTETFEIGLTTQNALGNGGVTIGEPRQTVISILANDDANGVVSFASSSASILLTELGKDNAMSHHNFIVQRNVGRFGDIVVGWEVLNESSPYDVKPLSGILNFDAYDTEESFKISVIDDEIPELEKILTVGLSIKSGGARLGNLSTATITIPANDNPNGLFSFIPFQKVIVEESLKATKITVRRNGGLHGRVSVDYNTRDGTARSINGKVVVFSTTYVFDVESTQYVHQFGAFHEDYMALATAQNIVLFVWKGTLVKKEEYAVRGITKINSLHTSNKNILIFSNSSSIMVYQFNENKSVTLLEEIKEYGIADTITFVINHQSFLAFVIGKDETNESIQMLQLYRWNGRTFVKDATSIQTYHAETLDFTNFKNAHYLIVGNKYNNITQSYNTTSVIYRWSDSQGFVVYGEISTNSVTFVSFFAIEDKFLIGVTNGGGNCMLHEHDKNAPGRFYLKQNFQMSCNAIVMLRQFDQVFLLLTGPSSSLFQLDKQANVFIQERIFPPRSIQYASSFYLPNPNDRQLEPYMIMYSNKSSENILVQLVHLNQSSDYVERSGCLIFEENEEELDLYFTVLRDSIPEQDETFFVELTNATNGSAISKDNVLEVLIMANDNAYGRFKISNSSLRNFVVEEKHDTLFKIKLDREFGSYGYVVIVYNVTSRRNNPFQDEIYPEGGQVSFSPGEQSKELILYLKNDNIPEIGEHFELRLTHIRTVGMSTVGGTINYMQNTALITVLPNDHPYGVFKWKNNIQVTTELTEVNSTVLLVIERQRGVYGDVDVSYETYINISVGMKEQPARPYIDFTPVNGSVVMKEGEREAFVFVNINHDGKIDFNEIFYVKLTHVKLTSNDSITSQAPPLLDVNHASVQVVITEVVQQNGVIEFQSPNSVFVTENVGMLKIPLIRTHGADATVGIYFELVFLTADTEDVSLEKGTVTFAANETRKFIPLNIIDDDLPELREEFLIVLTKPVGGAVIGQFNNITVAIESNDFPYGLFSVPADSVDVTFNEGDIATIPVQRLKGKYNQVSVSWSCERKAAMDISVTSGNLTFQQGETLKHIRFTIIDDVLPEVKETFTCLLMNVTKEAKLSNQTQVKVTIKASDKPFGVFVIAEKYRELAVIEPTIGYDGNFSVIVKREVGVHSMVEVSWKIQGFNNSINNTFETFSKAFGVLVFHSGEAKKPIDINVLSDILPEESQTYILTLLNPTKGAELNPDLDTTRSHITVAASANPYGIFSIQGSKLRTVTEDDGTVNLIVKRTSGLIGTVIVEYNVSSVNATFGEDYFPDRGVLVFQDGEGFKTVKIDIIDDSIPELAEIFTVELTSIALNKSIDFNQKINSIVINTPPIILTTSSAVEVLIAESDYPYGVIGFKDNIITVHEWEGVINIPVIRSGGVFGSSEVIFTYTPISATINSDFMINITSITFLPGQNMSSIPVQLLDDAVPEGKETFELYLQNVIGKAMLGNKTQLIVVIETSDNPHGLFGFFNVSAEIYIQNPLSPVVFNITVSRIAGNLGPVQVTWDIKRAKVSSSHVTEDLTPSRGSVNFADGQSGSQLIQVTILPYGGPQEEEERFTLSLVDVTGGATLDDSTSKLDIIVAKKGYPSGLFSLSSQIKPSSQINEPPSGMATVEIPIRRSFGRIGVVNVIWKVESTTGNISQDITYNASRVVTFQDQQSVGYILINVTADDEPELDEDFHVTLISVDMSGEISEQQKQVSFVITANDNPYGVFKLANAGQIFHLDSSNLQRSVQITVEREAGLIGDVIASVLLEHPDYAPIAYTLMVNRSQSIATSIFKVPEKTFLKFGTSYSVRLTAVNLIKDNNNAVMPVLAASPLLKSIRIPEQASNSIVQIANSSLFVSVDLNSNMASVAVTRIGLYGSVQIPWSYGYPNNVPIIAAGVITPSSGTVSMQHNQRAVSFSVAAVAPVVITSSYQYAVHLRSNLSPAVNQKGWGKLGENIYTVIEPHGVFRISMESQQILVLEGQPADVIIERMFNTEGTVRVRYQTKMHSGVNAAIPDEDYTPMTSYVDFNNGQFRKSVRISTIDDKANPKPETEETFFFQLISVELLTARRSVLPRLSANITSTVTIQDNDNPFGIISFSQKSRVITVDESAIFVELDIQRTGGTFSTASVEVVSIGGGELWSASIINNIDPNSDVFKALRSRETAATSSYDYDAVRSKITFQQTSNSPVVGQTQKISLRILQDNIAEPMEAIVVVLMNSTGGAKIFAPHSYAVVFIRGNGLYNGEVGFQAKTAILDEEGSGEVELPMMRVGEALQEVDVTWAATTSLSINLADQIKELTGTVKLAAGRSKSSITIQALKDTVPEFAAWFLVNLTSITSGAVIKPTEAVMNVTLLESDYPVGRIGFDERSRFIVLQLGDGNLQLTVRRYNGSLKATTVKYQTVSLAGMVKDGGVQMNPATEGSDYEKAEGTLKFQVGQTEAYINLKLSTTSSEAPYPRVFNVSLNDPTNGAVLYKQNSFARVIISKPGATSQFLKLRSSTLNLPLTDAQILDILNGLLVSIRSSKLTENDQQLIKNTIKDILSFKSSLLPGSKSLTSRSQAVLLDIFNNLMDTSRADTTGKSYWSKLLETSAYHFLNDALCPTVVSYTRSNFDVKAQRGNRTELNGLLFKSGSDFFRYPINMFSSNAVEKTCTDVHFISMNNQWFTSEKTTLNKKVLSSAIQTGLGSTNNKIVYRIHSPSNRITPSKVSCVIWTRPTSTSADGSWSPKNCDIVSETKEYIECGCNHLSEYTVLADSDDRTGFEIYFFVACFFTMGACLLALLSHHCCAIEKTFTSSLLMHLLFSVMITNMAYALAGYISPKLIDELERCSMLALFIHYFFLTQFTNMFVQACNLWRILVMNDEHSYRKSIPFFLIGWGAPVIIIITYVFVTHAVWDWKFTKMYGDVHGNGDMCFIAHGYAAFSVAVIPVLLIVVAICVVFVQAYQVTPQWKYYDDVYRGRYNIKEVRHVMILFSLIILTWVFGGIHLAYGSLWMIVTFTFFNVFTGLYIFVVYVILRNQMRYLFKGKYHVDQPPPERIEMSNVVYSGVDSSKQIKKNYAFNNPVDLNEWGDVELPRVTSQSLYSPISERNKHTDTFNTPASQRRYGNNNDSFEDEDSADFDDLIFALKSGSGYTPSVNEDNNEEPVDLPPGSSSSEQYTVRRIKIGDTHL